MRDDLIRYETDMGHGRRPGVRLGVFAAVNTLARRGLLTTEQEAYRRANNDWYDAHVPMPTATQPTLYSDACPLAAAWWKVSAAEPLARIPGYLAILDAHGVAWRARSGEDPGEVLYEDDVQVVAVPRDG